MTLFAHARTAAPAIRRGMMSAALFLRTLPLTWSVVALIVVGAIARSTLSEANSVRLNAVLGTGLDTLLTQRNWVGTATAVFFVEKPVYLAVVLLTTFLILGASERLMGSARTLVAFVLVSVLGIAAGTVIQGLGVIFDSAAAEQSRSQHTMDPMIPVVGTLMAATACLRPVVARRVRVVCFSLLLMFVLYSGQPSDIYRLAGGIAGLLIGVLMWRGKHNVRVATETFADVRALLAAVIATTAIGPLISVWAPAPLGLLEPLAALFRDSLKPTLNESAVSGADSAGSLLVTLFPLVLQLIAAFGILRGQRFGLWLAFGINAALATFAVIYFGSAAGAPGSSSVQSAHDENAPFSIGIAIGVPVLTVVLALSCLRFFPREPGRAPTRTFALRATACLLIFAGVYLVATSTRAGLPFAASFEQGMAGLPERLVPEGFLAFEAITPPPADAIGRFLYDWMGAAFWFSVVVLARAGMKRNRSDSNLGDSRMAKALLRRGLGSGPLAWMATWHGHRYWYDRDGDAIVAYRVVNGIAIATGQPLCTTAALPDVVSNFVAFCGEKGWTPVFYGVSEELTVLFTEMRWSSLKVAEETILDPGVWSLTGKKMQNVRTALTRASRLGIDCRWTRYDVLDAELRRQIAEISEEWVADKKLPEMGFTLGGLAELADPDVALMIAVTPEGRVEAVTSWLPTFRDGAVVGLTLDFMRRRADSAPGIMDVLIAKTMDQAKHCGLEMVSLSAAPLAESGTALSGFAATSMLSRILEPVYGFQSLHRYKSKFHPEIRPMYLAYADPFALPAIGLGLARAYVPSLSIRSVIGHLKTT